MSHFVTVLYNQPADEAAAAAFDEYYEQTHAPLARTLPELDGLTVIHPTPGPDGSPAPYHLIAILEYASAEACGRSFGSEIGQEVLADVPKFAVQGMTLTQGPGVR
ncbi:MAG: EthD family reductase [Gordonia sp. (in: high G+C Gram-positive bacteria)]